MRPSISRKPSSSREHSFFRRAVCSLLIASFLTPALSIAPQAAHAQTTAAILHFALDAKAPATCPTALPTAEAKSIPNRNHRLFRLVTLQNHFLGRELRKLEFLSFNSHTQLARELGQLTPEGRRARYVELEACLRKLKNTAEELAANPSEDVNPGIKMEVMLNYFQRLMSFLLLRVRLGFSIDSSWRANYDFSIPGEQLERITGFEEFLKHYPEARSKYFNTINKAAGSVIVDRSSQDQYVREATKNLKLTLGPNLVQSAELLGKRQFDEATFIRLFKAVMATALNFSFRSLDMYSYVENHQTPSLPSGITREFTYAENQSEQDRQERIDSQEQLFRQALYETYPGWKPKNAEGLSFQLFDLLIGYDNGHPRAQAIKNEYESYKTEALKAGNQFTTKSFFSAIYKRITGTDLASEKPVAKEVLIAPFRKLIADQKEADLQANLQKEFLEKRARFFPFVVEMFTSGFKSTTFDLAKERIEGAAPTPSNPSPRPSPTPPSPSATQPYSPLEQEIINIVKAAPFPLLPETQGPDGTPIPPQPDYARMTKTAEAMREIVKTYLKDLYRQGEIAETDRLFQKFLISEHVLIDGPLLEHITAFPLPLTDYLDGRSRDELRTVLKRMLSRSKFVAIYMGALRPEFSAGQLEQLEDLLDFSVRRFEKDPYSEGFLKDSFIDSWINAAVHRVQNQRKELINRRIDDLMDEALQVKAALDANPRKVIADPKILAEVLGSKWSSKIQAGHVTDYEVHFLNWALQSSSWASAHEVYKIAREHIRQYRGSTASPKRFEEYGRALLLDRPWREGQSPRAGEIPFIQTDELTLSIYADTFAKRKLYNPILSIQVDGERLLEHLVRARAHGESRRVAVAYPLIQRAARTAEQNYHALINKLSALRTVEDIKHFARTDKASAQFAEVFPEFRIVLGQVTDNYDEDMTREAIDGAYNAMLLTGMTTLGLQVLRAAGGVARVTTSWIPGVSRLFRGRTLHWMIEGINYNASSLLVASMFGMPVQMSWKSKLNQVEQANLSALTQMFTSGLDEESAITTYETVLAAQGRADFARQEDQIASLNQILDSTPDTRQRLAIMAGSAIFMGFAAKWGRKGIENGIATAVSRNLGIEFTFDSAAISKAFANRQQNLKDMALLRQISPDEAARSISAARRTERLARGLILDYQAGQKIALMRHGPAIKQDLLMDQPTLHQLTLSQRFSELQAMFREGRISGKQLDAARATYQRVMNIGYKYIGSNALAVENAVDVSNESYFYRFISRPQASASRSPFANDTDGMLERLGSTPLPPRFYFVHRPKPISFVRQVFIEESMGLTPLPTRSLPFHMQKDLADDFLALGLLPDSDYRAIQKAWTREQLKYNRLLTNTPRPDAKALAEYDRKYLAFRRLDELFDKGDLARRLAMDARNFRWETMTEDIP